MHRYIYFFSVMFEMIKSSSLDKGQSRLKFLYFTGSFYSRFMHSTRVNEWKII